ncbi:MAG: geranylgeranylglycerol-phosphate geranylgeranyltransferase [Bacteroidales bacterium]|nr:geranylgeranylglycerol-phosphate geranylgeranyltransferase [Bacteroidales bacterium]
MMDFIRLIRYKNLLIIVATMLVVRYALIGAFMPLQLSIIGFCLLITATVCISAAGYIINDYFDVNADMMNKPDKVIIGKTINRRNAMIMHWVLNIIGCICGGIVSFGIGRPSFTFIFLFITGILWFYSTTFSKEPVLGNVVVALLVAAVPMIEVLYEMLPLLALPMDVLGNMHIRFEEILVWSLGYTIFAFLLTLEREMVKDIEDIEGDQTYGRNTLPISSGINVARYCTIGVSLVVIIALFYAQVCKLNDVYSLLFLNIGVELPLLYSLICLIRADSAEDYSRVSFVLKLVMMMGLLFLIPKLF